MRFRVHDLEEEGVSKLGRLSDRLTRKRRLVSEALGRLAEAPVLSIDSYKLSAVNEVITLTGHNGSGQAVLVVDMDREALQALLQAVSE